MDGPAFGRNVLTTKGMIPRIDLALSSPLTATNTLAYYIKEFSVSEKMFCDPASQHSKSVFTTLYVHQNLQIAQIS
jgi:hypothetical protein